MEQNKNQLIKQFEGKEIDIILDDNKEPLFELYGVGMALGYITNSKGKSYPHKTRINKTLVNADIKPVVQGVQQYLTEEMIYDFMFEAKTEKCRDFRKWLSNDVLPSIRKYGYYQDRETEDCDNNYLKYNYKLYYKETINKDGIFCYVKKLILMCLLNCNG